MPAAAARSHRTCCLASSPIRPNKSKQARFHRYWSGIKQEMTPRRSFSMTNAPCSPPRTFSCPSLTTPTILDASRQQTPYPTSTRWGRAATRDRDSGLAGRSISTRNCQPRRQRWSRCLQRTRFPIGRRAQHRRTRAPFWSRCHRPRGESPSQTEQRCFRGRPLILTKPLGIGIHTTAEKQGKLATAHQGSPPN